MDKNQFIAQLEENPIIAAVKDAVGLNEALKSECRVIFVLFGTVLNIDEISKKVKAANKTCMVHVDLIDGLALHEISVDYIAKNTVADGIITTKQNLIRRASTCNLLAIQRFFLLDSLAIGNIQKLYSKDNVCAIEVLPGLMPKIIKRLTTSLPGPVIAGGLISEKEDVMSALSAGACAISSTNPRIWFM